MMHSNYVTQRNVLEREIIIFSLLPKIYITEQGMLEDTIQLAKVL